MTRKPGHHNRGGKAQHDVEHDGADVIANAGAGVAAAAAAQKAVDGVTDHARQEHHKRIHHALNQRHRDHVAVGNVGNLVAQHGFDLFARHALQQARRNGDQ